MDVLNLDAVGQARAIAKGDVSPEELARACLERIEALDGLLGAVTQVVEEVPAARSGPLRGVPLLVKEVLPWPGLRWSMGSRLFARQITRQSSAFGRRLQDGGLVCVGKTAMSEFGLLASTETLLSGITHNPWDLSRSPAGSSGGSAVAVAAGYVALAHANDGGGSIRMPASACGVFGFKPTGGSTVTATPGSSAWLEMTSDGFMSRSVRDAALALTLVAEPGSALEKLDFRALHLSRPLRIGAWTRTLSGAEPEPPVRRIYDETLALLSELGHEVSEVAAPTFDEELADAFLLVAGAAVAALVEQQDRARDEPVQRGELEPFTWSLLEEAEERGAPALNAARVAFDRAVESYRERTQGFDVVLTPTLAIEPWPIGYLSPLVPASELRDRIARVVAYTPIQNIARAPAMSVPLGESAAGLPIGMHFAALPQQDALLLALARQLEEARPWAQRTPRLLSRRV